LEKDCDKEGIPTAFQYSYNSLDPKAYSSAKSGYTKRNLIIPLSSTISAVVAPATVVIIALSVYCYRKKRRVTLHTSSGNMGSCPVIGSRSLIKTLPTKAKGKLAVCFLLRSPRTAYYVILADKFNLSPEEKNELQLYCQEGNTERFTEKLFECLETKHPQLTVGQLLNTFVENNREDLIQSFKQWLSEENYILDLDIDMNKNTSNNHLSSGDDHGTHFPSERILINQPDNLPLLAETLPDASPLPGTPPLPSPIQLLDASPLPGTPPLPSPIQLLDASPLPGTPPLPSPIQLLVVVNNDMRV
jgi:hypothetical protein